MISSNGPCCGPRDFLLSNAYKMAQSLVEMENEAHDVLGHGRNNNRMCISLLRKLKGGNLVLLVKLEVGRVV